MELKKTTRSVSNLKVNLFPGLILTRHYLFGKPVFRRIIKLKLIVSCLFTFFTGIFQPHKRPTQPPLAPSLHNIAYCHPEVIVLCKKPTKFPGILDDVKYLYIHILQKKLDEMLVVWK